MDLRQLHALLAVAEHQSFSAAARALHTVQSNVSTHVARLEKELGSTLIDRARGELTPEGEIVADRARRVIGELRSIEHDLASLRDDVSGHVRLGLIGTTARWLVAPLLRSLQASFPRIELVIIEATTTSLLPQLISERLDAAVINLPLDHPDVDSRPLFDEDRIIVSPLDHPLAELDAVTLANSRPPVLCPDRHGFPRRDRDRCPTGEGRTPSPRRSRRSSPADVDGPPGVRAGAGAGQRRTPLPLR